VLPVGIVEVSGAALKTISRWAAKGEGFADVTLHDRPATYVVGWEDGDILATQGDAHVHLDARGVVKNAVPEDLLFSQNTTD